MFDRFGSIWVYLSGVPRAGALCTEKNDENSVLKMADSAFKMPYLGAAGHKLPAQVSLRGASLDLIRSDLILI